jgi:hypothetical protein
VVGAALVALPAIGVPLGVASVTALSIEIANACFCHLWNASFMSMYLALFVFGVLGFSDKRRLFMRTDGDDEPASSMRLSVYELEDRLFSALGRKRGGEVQFDVVATFGLAIVAVVVYLAAEILQSSATFRWSFDWPWYGHPILLAVIYFLIGIAVALASVKRKWGWRGSSVGAGG